jgi:hypothetical protein
MTKTSLSNLIITRILRDGNVTLTQLEHRATERGVLLSDLYQALDTVHRDKRIRRGVKGGEVYYEVAKAKPTAISHTQWVTQNYPPMTADNDGSGIDADFSYLFLTPDEAKEYKANAKGLPVYMMKTYGRK